VGFIGGEEFYVVVMNEFI